MLEKHMYYFLHVEIQKKIGSTSQSLNETFSSWREMKVGEIHANLIPSGYVKISIENDHL